MRKGNYVYSRMKLDINPNVVYFGDFGTTCTTARRLFVFSKAEKERNEEQWVSVRPTVRENN